MVFELSLKTIFSTKFIYRSTKFLFQFIAGQCDGTIPKITEHPEDTFVARNDPATLRCQAEGDPDPKITWWKDGTAVETATSNPKVSLLFHIYIKQNMKIYFYPQ